MTNGEKIKEIFPDIGIYEHGSTYSINNEYNFNASWWNAEYKEPCEDWHDIPSEEMTLEQTRQAVRDLRKKLAEHLEQEPNTWSLDDAREDFMHDVYNTLDFLPTNNEANRIIDSFDRVTSNIKQEPTTKNDLGVDCTGRQETLD